MAQNYLLLIFFTFCYIIVDEGMQMANAEVRIFLANKKETFERLAAKKMK